MFQPAPAVQELFFVIPCLQRKHQGLQEPLQPPATNETSPCFRVKLPILGGLHFQALVVTLSQTIQAQT